MSKSNIVSVDKIHSGDVISLPQQSKIGLVFAVIKATDGTVNSLKIIPIHVHTTSYKYSNDAHNFMMPKSVKDELHLSQTAQYRVEFVLEDHPVTTDDVTIRYAKGSANTFSGKTILRMDAKIREERRISAEAENEGRVFVFRKDTPTHVKESLKPGHPHIPNISIDDAKKLGLIGETVHQAISCGTYGRGKNITTLREAYDMATSPKPEIANRYASILKTGLLASTVSLRTAFQEGILNESAAFNKLRDININNLGPALELLGVKNNKLSPKNIGEYIDPYDLDHFRTQPFLQADQDILLAWKNFKSEVANNPAALQDANIKYMYPA